MKQAIEIIQAEINQRNLAQKKKHLRFEETQTEINSLQKALDLIQEYEDAKNNLNEATLLAKGFSFTTKYGRVAFTNNVWDIVVIWASGNQFKHCYLFEPLTTKIIDHNIRSIADLEKYLS